MKNFLFFCTVFLCFTAAFANNSPTKFRYHQPAQQFNQALILGNGRLGATIYGGTQQEKIIINDDTFWSGEQQDGTIPDGPKIVAQIHEALLQNNHPLADKLAQKLQGPYNESYQPLETLEINFDHRSTPNDYSRELDLQQGVARISYTADGTRFSRTMFCSYPDQSLVIRLEADKPGMLNCTLNWKGVHQRSVKAESAGTLMAIGKAPAHVDPSYLNTKNPVSYAPSMDGKGMNYTALLKAESKDGTITDDGKSLQIKNATSVVIYVTARTSFNGYDKSPSAQGLNSTELATTDMNRVQNKNFNELLTTHLNDYHKLFDRVDFGLDEPKAPQNPSVKDLSAAFRNGSSQQLIPLIFQLGRYALIAGSRPGSQPLNLQGIWNEWVRPPWSSNYTMNINSQMNYWPVMSTNLAECAEPMLSFIEQLAKNGEKIARINYNCRGWVAHHNADVWRYAGSVGDKDGEPSWANFMGGGIWESFDFSEYYRYTQDTDFLRTRVYPLLKGAVQFSLDWLKPDKKGYYVPPFTVSSEATYITPNGYKGYCTLNSGQDIALYSELFANFISSCDKLNIKDSLYTRCKTVLAHLTPYQIDPEGKIKEWLEPGIDRPYGGNRNHLSQLIGFYPGRQLILQHNPRLDHAVKRTLQIFGPSTSGWMHAWEVNLWARQKSAENAYALVKMLAGRYGANDLNPDGGYQIDWLMGFTAGIVEMLMQSHQVDAKGNPVIELLPALPKQWPNGHIYGLRTRGGYEINMNWKNGKLSKCSIRNVNNHAQPHATVTVIANGKTIPLQIALGEVKKVM